MPDAGLKYTLTPEILLEIAKLPWPKDATGDWLTDQLVNGVLYDAINKLVDDNYGGYASFFIAVAAFLKENNYLPNIEEETVDPDILDSIDEMDARNW